jgi:hypothetical protein
MDHIGVVPGEVVMVEHGASGARTRAQLVEHLAMPARVLDTLERQAIAVPTNTGRATAARPAVYDTGDAALVLLAWRAYQLGVRGQMLRRLVDAARVRRSRLQPGWSGLVVFDGVGVDLLDGAGAVPVTTTALVVVPVEVER